MTLKRQRKYIVMVEGPDGTKKNVIMKLKPQHGSILEDGSRVVKVQ